ncbi:MAG TPA: DNA polymerase III subunit delta [Thermoguttaceae bacterium]|nr:DNA polymerase III subunit delta [Thermoguttaceae bacterium]
MSKPLDALDYLAQPGKHPAPAVCVVFGDEPFLARQVVTSLRAEVLGEEDAEFSLTTFEGRAIELRDVLDELATRAMFGGSRRLVVVEEADPFVTRYRAELEDYVAAPGPGGILVLLLKTFPANTRLYKAAAASGLVINAAAPPTAKLARWIVAWAKQAHQAKITSAAADMLVDLVGPELGLLNQELAKMALSVGPGGQITPDTVTQMVGTWRAKTTWDMLDAALDGKTPEALAQLDRLLLSGEVPISILGQISASLRRLAAATRIVLKTEAAGRRPALGPALQQAGVKPFVLEKTQRQLRQLGRHRGARMYRALLQADLDLKGASPLPPRLVLERLILWLSAKEVGNVK